MNFTVAEVILFIFLCLALSVLAFSLGRVLQHQRDLSQFSLMSFVASFYAATEAKSLSNVSALMKIVEQQNQAPGVEDLKAQLEEVDDEWQNFMNNSTYFSKQMRDERRKRNIDSEDWDGEIEETMNAEDLV